MRFLLDENMPGRAAAALRQRGHEVLLVGEAGLRGADDERVVEFCNEKGLILITLDVGVSLLASRLTTGLLLVRAPRGFGPTEVTKLLEDALDRRPELEGLLTVAMPGRIRSRPLR